MAWGKPVLGVAVVFGWDFGTVDVGDGADLGNVPAATVEGVVDGEEVFCGKVIDPGDPERFAAAGFDEGSEGAGAVAPHAGGGNVVVKFGVNLLHGDGEGAMALVEDGRSDLRQRESIDEGRKLQRVEHRRRDAGRIWRRSLYLSLHLHAVHGHVCHRCLWEDALCVVEEAEGRGLLQKRAAGRRQRELRRRERVWIENKHAS